MRSTNTNKVITIVLLSIIVVALAIVAVLFAQQLRTDQVSEKLRNQEHISFIFAVHDDTRLVSTQAVFLHSNSRRLVMIDIPAEVGAIIPRLGRVDSIGSLFTLEGLQVYVDKISDLIESELNYYIFINTEQLVDLIDIIGGIEVFIPDPVRDLENGVLLPGGTVLLDGSKSKDYFLYDRDVMTAQEHMSRNQEVTSQILYTLGNQQKVFEQNPQLVLRTMNTDFDRREFEALIRFLRTIDTGNLIQQRVLGSTRAVEVGDEINVLLFPHFEGQLLKDTVKQVKQTLASGDTVDASEPIRLELLNGTNRTGLASRARELFEGYGFQVISVGNADSSDYQETVVYDRQGTIDKAESAADVIGSRRIETRPDYEGDVVTDVTVILGSDFDGWRVRN